MAWRLCMVAPPERLAGLPQLMLNSGASRSLTLTVDGRPLASNRSSSPGKCPNVPRPAITLCERHKVGQGAIKGKRHSHFSHSIRPGPAGHGSLPKSCPSGDAACAGYRRRHIGHGNRRHADLLRCPLRRTADRRSTLACAATGHALAGREAGDGILAGLRPNGDMGFESQKRRLPVFEHMDAARRQEPSRYYMDTWRRHG